VLDLKTGQQKMLVKPGMGGRLLPSGRLLYFWNGELLDAPFDRMTMTLTEPGVSVLSGVSPAGWTGPNADLSSNGTLVYVPAAARADTRLVWVDLKGRQSPVPVPPGPFRVMDLSSDGRHLLLLRDTGPENGNLLDYDLKSGSTRELVADADYRACWSADARSVVFSKIEPGEPLPTLHLFHLGSNQTERLAPFRGVGQFGVQAVAATGQIAFVTGYHPRTQIDVWSVLERPSSSPVAVAVGPGIQTHPRVSPDGKWIAYVDGGPPGTIVIRSFGSASVALKIPAVGAAPMWSADGRWLYYRSGRRFLEAQFTPGAPARAGVPHLLFEGDFVPPSPWRANTFFDSSRGRFLLSLRDDVEAPPRIEVITNWLQQISRR
jgi:hypothetical protein